MSTFRTADDHGLRPRGDVFPHRLRPLAHLRADGRSNFAHGAFITVGSYGTWWAAVHIFDGVHSSLWRWLLGALVGLLLGGVFAALVEFILIRPLYGHIEQVLVTVGLQLAFVALVRGIWAPTRRRSSSRRGCTRRRTSAAR